jgi:hypothetical protein
MNTIEKLRIAFRERPFLGSFGIGLLLLSGLVLFFAGCSPRPTVTGLVKVDGEPLARGSIEFVPVDDKGAIAADRGTGGGATIKEGTYLLEKGLTVGRYRVEIQGIRATARKVLNPLLPAEYIQEEVAVVPPKFNEQSTLFREVSVGSNQIDFDLEGIRAKPAKAGK